MTDVTTVVYVEDDADIVELVQMIFEAESDLKLVTCRPDDDVLHCIRQCQPGIVLLDVMMPGLDGRAIANAMRSDPTLTQVPFVFMTAKARPTELAELYKLGALGVISKPFDVLKLPEEVRRLIAKPRV